MAEIDPENHVTLLLDGDTVAYVAASAVQSTMETLDGFVMPFAKREEGEAVVDSLIIGLFRDLDATGLQVALSDPEGNWRTQLAADYKSDRNVAGLSGEVREHIIRPLLLGRMKDYLRVKYGAFHWPALEADDTLGILMTTPGLFPGKRIMVGRDKDFDTIPGLHHQIGRDVDPNGRPIVREVSEPYANWFHLCQAFAGDRVDGYPGCPGIGMKRAQSILADPYELVPEEGSVTRGPRKGQTTTAWRKQSPASPWQCIVSHYRKEGLDEADALRNARLARVLRHGDYDQDSGSIRLWTPTMS
jgi:hypothetical protein